MAHTNDKVCLTVVVYFVRDSKVLLANHPVYNTWLPVGGHIDPGEDPDEALYREIKEETGLDRSDVRIFSEEADIPEKHSGKRVMLLTPAFVDRHNVGDRDHVAITYFGEILSERQTLTSEEHKELRWFTQDELKENKEGFKPDIVWYSLRALEAAKGMGADSSPSPR